MRILRSLGTVALILSLLALLTFVSPTRSYAQSNSGIIQGTEGSAIQPSVYVQRHPLRHAAYVHGRGRIPFLRPR
jgi:hypothetical protein